jgi:hypothetical protein
VGTRVNRAELLQTLQRVDPGLSTRDFVEQSTSYVFSDGWCATFNDEVCCRSKTGLPPELAGAVKASPLRATLENMADDEVELEVRSGELRVRAHRIKVDLRLQHEILLPVEQVDAPAAWVTLPEEFTKAVEAVVPAAGTDQQEFLSTCVHVHPKWLEACDRRQATRYEVESGLSRPFLVRARSLAHVVPMGVTKAGETDNWVHFRNKTTVLSIRRHLDQYPDIGRMMAFRGTPAVLPRGAIQAAKLGGVFTADDKENDRVLVRMFEGNMEVVGEGANGRSTVELVTTYTGEEIRFRVAPALLARIVQNHTQCEIVPGKLKVVGERWTYVVLLNVADERTAPAAPPEPADSEETDVDPVASR